MEPQPMTMIGEEAKVGDYSLEGSSAATAINDSMAAMKKEVPPEKEKKLEFSC